MSAPPAPPTLDLGRLHGERFGQDLQAFNPSFVPLSDQARRDSLERVMRDAPRGCPVGVFAYGSLLWNPLLHVASRARARAFGYHRRLCLVTRVARGSPAAPGLTLALDRGGSCEGEILAIDPAHLQADLELLWKREMADDAYEPRWAECRTPAGRQKGIAFVARRGHARYFAERSPEIAATFVAHAVGAFGSCYDYVSQTVGALRSAEIRDGDLEKVLAFADQLRRQGPGAGNAPR